MTGLAADHTVIVPMAGRGRRFAEQGFAEQKFRIEVRGRSLFTWAMRSLANFAAADCPFIFVALGEDDARRFIEDACAALGIRRFELVGLPDVTDGQATTALAAGPAIGDADQGILIYNIDTYVDPRHLRPEFVRGGGWVPCFKAAGNQWSFVRAGEDGRIVEIAEKRRISDNATIGLYGFRSFELFRTAYEARFVRKGRADAGERYVAPLYNELIERGHTVVMHDIPTRDVHCLGTPEEVRVFENSVREGEQ